MSVSREDLCRFIGQRKLVEPQCSLVSGWEAEQTLQYEGQAEEMQPSTLHDTGRFIPRLA